MNLQLKTFNGVDVLNLKHLDELIENNTSEFARFEMDEHVYVLMETFIRGRLKCTLLGLEL